jgi:diguanylate cyclase (GGDEF)-like protein/putative nucleotidyltransferase with HDIG domain
VDGPSQLARTLGPVFGASGIILSVRTSADDIRRCIEEGGADLLIIDMHLPHGAAFELCGDLRSSDADRLTPIMLLSPDPASEPLVVRGLLCGADDCFAGALTEQRITELQARIRVQLRNRRERDRLLRVRKERDSYRREAVVDTLTGLPNRRSLGTSLERLLKRGRTFGVLFVDVDHFKSINDGFGHDVGDEVLKGLAGCIRKTMRPGDACGRYGGEEFVLVAPDADAERACALAETLRASVEELVVPALERSVTVSVGVAVFQPGQPDTSVEAICKRADSALYEAKRLGRNRVQLAPSASEIRGPERVSGITVATIVRPAEAAVVEAELVKALATGRAGLPLLPEAAAEALRLAEDPRTNMSNIAHLVDRDPPLAARFVALAGSAVYSRGARIVSTQAALVRIGLASSRDLLLQVVYERSNAELPHYQSAVERSFARSLRAAIAAKLVAREQGRAHEYAYLCGLLHDIGEARIYRILAQMRQPPSEDIASQLAGRHHQRAGADIARAWRLPSDIVDACALHHARADNLPTSVRIVRAAEALLRILEKDSDANAEASILTAAGLRPERVAAVLKDLEAELAPPPEEEAEDGPEKPGPSGA